MRISMCIQLWVTMAKRWAILGRNIENRACEYRYFDPIEFGDEGFVDGATGANNPVSKLWTEAGAIWRQGSNWQLHEKIQCLVSVGTGMPSLEPFGDDPVTIGLSLLAIATETQKTVEQFQRDRSHLDEQRRLFRFNVMQGLEKVGLEDISKRKAIIAATRKYLESQTAFKELKYCSKNLAERGCASQFA